ncbi:MAG: hypothetical protein IKS41_00100 [Alphaproteobacteria bacterium]|nr:hypothetical protein [Alphaproteobacteria bacterium]
MKNIKYYYYSLLSRLASPDLKDHYREKKNRYRYSPRERTMVLLERIENHMAFERFYAYFKKNYHIEIPMEADGIGNHYEYVKVRLKDLKGYCPGSMPRFKPLSETFQYRFLTSRNTDFYQSYLANSHHLNSLHFSSEHFLDLEKSLKKTGYDPSQSVIVIDGDNRVRDGLHRASILLHLMGPETEVPVIRITTR